MILGKVALEDRYSWNGLYRQQVNRKDTAIRASFSPENLTPAPWCRTKVQNPPGAMQKLIALLNL